MNNGINHLSIGAGFLPSTVSQATGYELRFGVLKVYTDTFRQQSMDAFWQNVLRNSTDKDANKKKHDAKSQGFGCFCELVAKAAMGDSSGVELVAATLTHIFTAATCLVLLARRWALAVSGRTSQ